MTELSMYPNVQYSPKPIQDYTILEFHKDEITSHSKFNTFILPIEGLTVEAIEQKIAKIAAENVPTGYTKAAALSGRQLLHEYSSYNHRICFIVYYNGTNIPQYPARPEIGEVQLPHPEFNPWNEITIVNEGAYPASATINMVVATAKPVEFYINNDFYSIAPPTRGDLEISDKGIFINNEPVSSFTLTQLPKLKSGKNTLKILKNNVSSITVSYKPQY